ncbi:multiple sugar transport system permease protein/sn-glycerol 3-phosphate transport system permease protein [Paenibacillus taihuensis]|uniref:Multiple sugar transport system permease protein/sn-glycerol 3-phosphate transport system permease protein n=1 Tax=Paenibacillus taihuensis TaxID=1156355 RepID=A0A3D9S1J3_9BACL|nr:carbohydrate ABC transporter permease [Paenibacillus taihuensis]REE86181.1 multiple sugar transport system permease protein/sn-glycerol 3-phosphate transport system permease protein [Paenibacillus taihuensis]
MTFRIRKFAGLTVSHLVLAALSLACIIPFLWMISTSLKTKAAMWEFPPKWIPKNPLWHNYHDAFTLAPFGTYITNTLTLEILTIAGQVISCTLIAYGFSRFRFRGRDTLFFLMLATMLIPEQVTMIPTFLFYSKLEWIDTYLPLVVPAFFGNAFYVFLMRQFLLTIPKDLDEAAKIDGANEFQILWKVLVPILRPSLTIIVVYTFTGVYNDFLSPLIYLNSPEKFTLAIGLANFVSSRSTEWNLLMAASTVILLPLLVIYYMAQKNLIGGIASLGIKG